MRTCLLSCFSRVRLFATSWMVAHQAPLSMGILQARILEWVAISFTRGLPNPGTKLAGRQGHQRSPAQTIQGYNNTEIKK